EICLNEILSKTIEIKTCSYRKRDSEKQTKETGTLTLSYPSLALPEDGWRGLDGAILLPEALPLPGFPAPWSSLAWYNASSSAGGVLYWLSCTYSRRWPY